MVLTHPKRFHRLQKSRRASSMEGPLRFGPIIDVFLFLTETKKSVENTKEWW